MKATNSLLSAPLILKLVGCILILSSLIDYTVQLIPFTYQEDVWIVGTITRIIERGILPMIGMALLFTGYWLEGGGEQRSTPFISLRFWTVLLSILLGLIFLLAMPIAWSSYGKVSELQIKEINKKAENDQAQVAAKVQQSQDQLTGFLSNKQAVDQQLKGMDEQLKQIDEAIAKGDIKGDQLAEIQKRKKAMEEVKADPTKLSDKLREKLKEESSQFLTKIKETQLNQTNQVTTGLNKGRFNAILSSILLTIGYTAIGVLGLRNLGSLSGDRKA
jgi:hypothetical protein